MKNKILSITVIQSLIMTLLLPLNLRASEFVVGPATGAVFGPSESSGSALDGIILNVTTTYSADALKKIGAYSYEVDKKDGSLSCQYDADQAKATSISAGVDRMSGIADSVADLDEPNGTISVGDPDLSQSAQMYTASEVTSASQLTSNEMKSKDTLDAYLKKCETLTANSAGDAQIQLYSYGCMIYQVVKQLNDLSTDSDTLSQKVVELNTVLNQAIAENSVREEKVAAEKEKITTVNNDLTKTITELKKAKAEFDKATKSLAEANASLATANAMTCDKKDDGTEDCSAKEAAISSAAKAVTDAKLALEKAEKQLKKYTEKLIDLLKEKFNNETTTILALMSATIRGETGSKDVHFEVNGTDYTLVNANDVINSFASDKKYNDHYGSYMQQNPNATEQEFLNQITEGRENDYYKQLTQHLNESNDSIKTYYDIFGNKISREQSNGYNTGIYHTPDQSQVTSGIIDKFSSAEGGSDYILTLATAVVDYQSNANEKKLARLEGMKTPQSRINQISKKIEEHTTNNKKIRDLMANNICILKMLIKQFRETIDATVTVKDAANKSADPYLNYIYNLDTKLFEQKLKEGYKSSVNLNAILIKIECYAGGLKTC